MKKLKKKLENLLLRKYLNALTEEQLLLNLSEARSKVFALDAKDYLIKDSLFNILLTDSDSIATGMIARKATDIDKIRFARAMIYCNDLIRKKVELLAKGLPTHAQRVGRE